MVPPPTLISDPDDARIDLYRDSRDADLRGGHDLFLVESVVCIERWLRSIGRRSRGEVLPPALGVHSLLVSPAVLERLRADLLAARLPEQTSLFVAEPSIIEHISGFDHHHGALGLGRRSTDDAADRLRLLAPFAAGSASRALESSATAGVLMVTDGVVHVDNMGSLFRNAAALGAGGVLLSPRCADPLVRKTIRISMGHLFGVPWAVADDLPGELRRLRAGGVRVSVAENTPNAVDIDRAELTQPCAIVFGAEGHGVSPSVMAEADEVLRVPSREGIPLNVAVTSAIVLHELGRAERHRATRGR